MYFCLSYQLKTRFSLYQTEGSPSKVYFTQLTKLVRRNICYIPAELCGNCFNFGPIAFSKETCFHLNQGDPWTYQWDLNSMFLKGLLIAICNIKTLNLLLFIWSVLPKWSLELDEVFLENNSVTISTNLRQFKGALNIFQSWTPLYCSYPWGQNSVKNRKKMPKIEF